MEIDGTVQKRIQGIIIIIIIIIIITEQGDLRLAPTSPVQAKIHVFWNGVKEDLKSFGLSQQNAKV